MPQFGMMGVDWEERINFDRMRRERLQKAKAAMEKADVDALFIFALEDVRYLTGYRNHLGPVTTLGQFTYDRGLDSGRGCIRTMSWDVPSSAPRGERRRGPKR